MKRKEDYLRLPYTRQVELVREDDGSEYFLASIQELPGVRADGANPIEAKYHLQQAFEEYLDAMLEWGDEIPEPDSWPAGYGVAQDTKADRAAPVTLESFDVTAVSEGDESQPRISPWREGGPRWRDPTERGVVTTGG